MSFSNLAALAANAELTLEQKAISSAKVVLTGFVVVFSMLLLLILIIKIYGTIITAVQQKSKGKKKKEKIVETKASTPLIVPVAAPSVSDDGIPEEVVAVISAAVACMYSSPEKVKIKSIKKTNSGRSAWANAGVLDNTRPF